MEAIQVHSKSWIVRWVDVAEHYSIAWNVQPHKKGLNLGIFKHPGSAAITPSTPSSSFSGSIDHASNIEPRQGGTKAESGNIIGLLEGHGFKCVSWEGKCEADQITIGRYDVPAGAGGTYGIVLDNTFSRAVAKDVTLAYVIHTTDNAPKFGGLRAQQRKTSSHSVQQPGSVTSETVADGALAIPSITVAKHTGEVEGSASLGYLTGIMYKKRRKKNQGYAKRFFSLDFVSATLSYYRDSSSSALRGAIPLSLASIGIDGRAHEFHIDSGAEVWHIRLRNRREFEAWKKAFNRVAGSPMVDPSSIRSPDTQSFSPKYTVAGDSGQDREWQRIEALVGRISGSRHALRRLAQDTDPTQALIVPGLSPGGSTSELASPSNDADEHPHCEKPSFWRRKPSAGSQNGAPSLFRRVSGGPSTNHASNAALSTQRAVSPTKSPRPGNGDEVHRRCMALLHDLDTTVHEFSALLVEHKSRYPVSPVASSMTRASIDSTHSAEEFYDAEEGDIDTSRMLHIVHSDHAEPDHEKDFASDVESDTSSEADFRPVPTSATEKPQRTLFPQVADVTPKAVPALTPRGTLEPPKQSPPSIIAFLRKNAGKDLSTVAMPVTANEPTSLLQRLAEPLESASLLTSASDASLNGSEHVVDRLLYVAAFAVAGFASNRVKERALRKPFNPMLGETYELVRRQSPSDDSPAYRFVAEKVTHHPVRMAWQADSLNGSWSVSQSSQPTQKFWGKSMELNTTGKVRVALHNVKAEGSKGHQGERYSWTQATGFLRNIIAGEKYVEPVQSMTILNEDTGHRAVATFKASGIFAGRSEDLTVAFYRADSQTPLPVKLTGKWTSSLVRSDTNETIWEAGPLIPDAAKVYGFTLFAAGLNEITDVERGVCAPTDSRLRPDQRALEDGLADQAEGTKARLEERQRARRKLLEAHGKPHEPAFFVKCDVERASQNKSGNPGEADEVWVLKEGHQSYWRRRERQDWEGLVPVFEL